MKERKKSMRPVTQQLPRPIKATRISARTVFLVISFTYLKKKHITRMVLFVSKASRSFSSRSFSLEKGYLQWHHFICRIDLSVCNGKERIKDLSLVYV